MPKPSPIRRLDAPNRAPGAHGRQQDAERNAAPAHCTRRSTEPAPLDVAGARGEPILNTGATGFIGKLLVEKLLRLVPDVGHSRICATQQPPGRTDEPI